MAGQGRKAPGAGVNQAFENSCEVGGQKSGDDGEEGSVSLYQDDLRTSSPHEKRLRTGSWGRGPMGQQMVALGEQEVRPAAEGHEAREKKALSCWQLQSGELSHQHLGGVWPGGRWCRMGAECEARERDSR